MKRTFSLLFVVFFFACIASAGKGLRIRINYDQGKSCNYTFNSKPAIVFKTDEVKVKANGEDDASFSFGKLRSIVFPENSLGDANGDGDVNILDVTMTISHVLGENPTGFIKEAADVDGNNIVDIVDVTSIIDIILNHK